MAWVAAEVELGREQYATLRSWEFGSFRRRERDTMFLVLSTIWTWK